MSLAMLGPGSAGEKEDPHWRHRPLSMSTKPLVRGDTDVRDREGPRDAVPSSLRPHCHGHAR